MIERTFILVLSNLLAVGLLFFSLRPALKCRFNQRNLVWIFPVLILFCLFSFWGPDWFHYMESYELLKGRADLFSQLEPFYRELIELTPNYLIFRLAIWGTAIVFTFIAFKLLNLDLGLASYFFVICSLIWFSYGRVSLAFAISLLGISILLCNRRRLFSVPLGILLLLSSIYFHKSAVFIIGIAFMTVILQRFPQGIYKTMIFLFPLLAILVTVLLSSFMNFVVSDESDLIQTVEYGQRYLSHNSTGLHFGSLGIIPSKILEWLPKYFVAYICLKLIKNDNGNMPKQMMFFCVMYFLIMYVSSFFIFDLGYSTSTIFSRFQRFAILPEVVVMTYFIESGTQMHLTKKAHFLFIASTFYTLLYQTYCAIG